MPDSLYQSETARRQYQTELGVEFSFLPLETDLYPKFAGLGKCFLTIETGISANFDPGGWDKPIPEVINLWRHRTSTPNNLEKSRLVGVLDMFWTFLDKNEKNNQTPHWGRDSGIPSSCPRFATSTTRQASSWITNLGHSDGIPSSLPQCGVRFYYSHSWDRNIHQQARIQRGGGPGVRTPWDLSEVGSCVEAWWVGEELFLPYYYNFFRLASLASIIKHILKGKRNAYFEFLNVGFILITLLFWISAIYTY